MSKGSGRRKENTQRFNENHGGVSFGVRDKSGDTFKVNENHLLRDDKDETDYKDDPNIPEFLKVQSGG